MNYDYRVFLFRGTRTEEKLQIDRECISLSVGQIVCAIMDLGEDFFCREQVFVKRIKENEKEYLSKEIESSFKNDDLARAYLQQLREVLHGKRPKDQDEALLHHLIIVLPCFYAYEMAYIPTMRSLPNSAYLSEVPKSTSQSDDKGNNIIVLAYQQMEQEVMKYADAYAGWNSFFTLLEDDSAELFWSIIAKEIFGVKGGYSYASLLESCLSELRRLQIDLRQNNSESHQLLGGAIPGPKVYQGSASLIGPDDKDNGRYAQVFEITSFSDLVRAERMLLSVINREVRHCKVCGKCFVPYRTEAYACQRSNPRFGRKTCSKVYSQMKYREAHPDLNTPMGKLYLKRYKAYSKWANESVSFVINNAKLIYNEKDMGRAISEITKEITELQEAWRKKAKDTLELVIAEEINEDQFEEQAKLPKIIDRSPRLAAFRQEVLLSLGVVNEADKS